MTVSHALGAIARRADDYLRAADPGGELAGSARRYVDDSRRWRPARYADVCPAMAKAEASLKASAPRLAARLNRLLIARHLADFELQASAAVLPETVCALYPPQLERLLRQLRELDDSYYDLGNDSFLKDLAIDRKSTRLNSSHYS